METIKARMLVNYDPFAVFVVIDKEKQEGTLLVQLYNRAVTLLRVKVHEGILKFEVPKEFIELLDSLIGIGFTDNISCGAQWIKRGQSLLFVGGTMQWDKYIEIRPLA